MKDAPGAIPPEGYAPYLRKLDEMRQMHIAKAHDYGTDQDPLSNLRASAQFGVEPWVGAVIRMNDKVTRIASLCQKGTLKNESVEDSLLDIAAYALLALVLLDEKRSRE